MHNQANIVVAYENAEVGADLQKRLNAQGFNTVLVGNIAGVLSEIERDRPHLVLLGQYLDGQESTDLISRVRAVTNAQETAVALLSNDPSRAVFLRALDVGFDDVITLPVLDEVLVARVRPLTRVGTIWAEKKWRDLVAGDFGLAVAPSPSGTMADEAVRLMYIGSDPHEAGELKGVLGSRTDVTTVADMFSAEDTLTRERFEAVFVSVPGDPVRAFDFCAHVRNNPQLYNLPVVLLIGEISDHDLKVAYTSGASRICWRPVEADMIRATVSTLIARQQARWAVSAQIRASLTDSTRDKVPSVYNRAYMDKYLAGRFADSNPKGRFLSLIYLSFPAVASLEEQYGDAARDHLLNQLGQWISNLLRAEDLCARYGANDFCIVLPETPLSEARLVMERIAGIIAVTDFAVNDVFHPVKVWPHCGAADATLDDSAESLVTRARGDVHIAKAAF